MSQHPLAARRSAAYLIDQITSEGRLMSDLVASGALEKLDPADRARAQRLATETLRQLSRCDTLLDAHMTRTPPLAIHNLLRLGAYEIVQGEAAHGVVNAYVELAGRSRRHARLKGLVNAVLRKIEPTDLSGMPVPRMPDWLRDPLKAAWGKAALQGMEKAHVAGAPLDVTAKSAPQDVATRLEAEVLPSGSVRLKTQGHVSRLAGFESGDWWVQDAAAAIPAQLLQPQQGERVLDLCAAPGGKTLQLAAAGAEVTAVDMSAKRLERVSENLERTGLKAELRASDAFEVTGQWPAILLDAPCSATGTMRRHPDLPYAKDGAGISELIELQARMIDHAFGLLEPGGRLMFCTCSLLPDEGEVQVDEALGRHKDMKVLPLDAPWIAPEWRSEEGGLRLFPHFWADQGGMDGFYIALLQRVG